MNVLGWDRKILQHFRCSVRDLCVGLCNVSSLKRNKVYHFAGVIKKLGLAVICLTAYKGVCAEPQYTEYDIKGAYLHQLGRFARWPFGVFSGNDSPFTICIVGESPFSDRLLTAIRNKTVNNRRTEVQTLDFADELSDSCHIVYISQSERPNIPQILALLETLPVLTVSDIGDFARQGGMIEFLTLNEQVKIIINLSNAKRNRINISSELLSLAQVLGG